MLFLEIIIYAICIIWICFFWYKVVEWLENNKV
jgi:hypothetical protein